jgi:hypothetical protein
MKPGKRVAAPRHDKRPVTDVAGRGARRSAGRAVQVRIDDATRLAYV